VYLPWKAISSTAFVVVYWQDFVANSSDVSDTSAGVYEMTSPAGIPANGACPSSLSSNRRRMTSVAAQIIGNSAATMATPSGGGSSVSGGASSTPSGAVGEGEGLASVLGSRVSTATEQRLSRLLDKIYESIELNELRLLIQDHKDAVKLEWQQVIKITLRQCQL